MAAGHLRRASVVRGRQHPGHSYAGSYPGSLDRESWRGHDDGRAQTFWGLQCGACARNCDNEAENLVLNWKNRKQDNADADLVSEEAARNIDFFASNHYDFLARKNLLGDNRGQSTKEMTLAINNDGCRRESGHGRVLRVVTISFFPAR